MAVLMKDFFAKYIKPFLDSPKVTLALLAILFPTAITHFLPEKAVEAKEKPVELQIRAIDTKPMNEIVIPSYAPHVHPEIVLPQCDCKALIDEHESGRLH